MRRWVLFWCAQSYAWAWDAPAAVQSAGHELASDPYAVPFVLAPDPYPAASGAEKMSAMNRRSRRGRVAGQLAPSPYGAAGLAPMPYAGRLPERALARPSAQPLALAASPYVSSSLDLAPDPY